MKNTIIKVEIEKMNYPAASGRGYQKGSFFETNQKRRSIKPKLRNKQRQFNIWQYFEIKLRSCGKMRSKKVILSTFPSADAFRPDVLRKPGIS